MQPRSWRGQRRPPRRRLIRYHGTFTPKHRFRPRLWERFAWCAALILAIMLSIDIFAQWSAIDLLREELRQVDLAMEANRMEYQRLLLEQEYRLSDAFVERYAREELEWLRPGDLYFNWP